jgi:hypothetical protein
MKKREVDDAINQQLAAALGTTDFRKKRNGFIRPIPGGRQTLFTALEDYRAVFRFTLAFGIRLNEVEDVYNRFSGSSPDLQETSDTVVGRLESFVNLRDHFVDTPGPRKKIQVTSQAEIVDAFCVLSPVIQEKVIPFFESHKDLKSIDQLLNPDEETAAAFDITRRPDCDMHALIVAHLVDNPRFDALLEKKRKELEGFNELDARKFAQLVDYLTSQRKSKR